MKNATSALLTIHTWCAWGAPSFQDNEPVNMSIKLRSHTWIWRFLWMRLKGHWSTCIEKQTQETDKDRLNFAHFGTRCNRNFQLRQVADKLAEGERGWRISGALKSLMCRLGLCGSFLDWPSWNIAGFLSWPGETFFDYFSWCHQFQTILASAIKLIKNSHLFTLNKEFRRNPWQSILI